jgi:hypothetical protein
MGAELAYGPNVSLHQVWVCRIGGKAFGLTIPGQSQIEHLKFLTHPQGVVNNPPEIAVSTTNSK